jgi:hypothetical protein
MRGIHWYVGCSFLLLALAGCNGWFAQREPWRRDAEEQCLRSGAVREGPGIALLRPIDGPGICGADFPLKVEVLGETNPLGFADDPRPPGLVPGAPTYAPPQQVPNYSPRPTPGQPLQLAPPSDPDAGRDARTATAPLDDSYRYRGPQPAPARPAPFGQAPQAAIVSTATLTPAATLACPVVSALDRWITDAVQPAAMHWFMSPVVEIKQISAYSCRGMNGQWGAPISEHAFGNALDVAAFTLADGRRITVRDGWHGMPAEQGFLRDVEAAACERFTTVLAPGSNAFHYDHIHVDLMRHASGNRICNPQPASGEEVAAGAQARMAGRRPLAPPPAWSAAGRRGEPVGDEYYESNEYHGHQSGRN